MSIIFTCYYWVSISGRKIEWKNHRGTDSNWKLSCCCLFYTHWIWFFNRLNTGIPENWHMVLLWQLLDCLTDDVILYVLCNTTCQKWTCTYFLSNEREKLTIVTRVILQWYLSPGNNPVKNISSDTVICGSKNHSYFAVWITVQAEDLKLLIHKINGRQSL